MITSLSPSTASGYGLRPGVQGGNAKVLAAFRKHLAKSGLGATRLE